MSESILIRQGPWKLRFLIVNSELETNVLSYLTSNGLGNVVTIEPGNEPDKQAWAAIPVDSEKKKDHYIIIQDVITVPPNSRGLTRVKGSDKIILSEQPTHWLLEITKLGNKDVYKIHPPPESDVSVTVELLGKEGNEAAIQLLLEAPGKADPAWQFLVLPEPEA